MPHLPKKERLRSSREFKAVFERCRRWKDALLAVYVRSEEDPAVRRFGVSVGHAHGNAVRRNRLKRRLREVYRGEKERFRGGYRLVVIPQRGCAERSFEEIRRSFRDLAQKAGLYSRTERPEPGGAQCRDGNTGAG